MTTLSDFANQTLGGTYGNPPPVLVRNQGTFQGQCVSLERQALASIDGVNWGPVGNAVDYANPTNQARYASIGYTWKAKDTNFQEGDVLVYGDDAGSFTGPAGHIARWYQGRLLNQNYGGSLKVTQNSFFTAGYLGRYTKGGSMFTEEQIQVMAIMATGSIPGKDYSYPETQLEINSANLDVTLQTWQSRVSVITPELEERFAIMATGSTYGKDYNSQFQGKPTLEALIPCVEFWVSQRQDSTPLKPYNGPQLYIK